MSSRTNALRSGSRGGSEARMSSTCYRISSSRAAFRVMSGLTMARSSSPRPSRTGSMRSGRRQPTLLLVVLGRTDTSSRHRIVARAAEGKRIAKAKGKSLGRRPTLNLDQQTEALVALAAGESARGIASRYRVHHSTISRLKTSTVKNANATVPAVCGSRGACTAGAQAKVPAS